MKKLQNFVSLFLGYIAATGGKTETDRRTHTPASHFIIQLLEVTGRELFVHKNIMSTLASCAQ